MLAIRLAAALLLTTLLSPGRAVSAQTPLYDPEQLPAFRGTVEAYILSPCDEVDGFFLDDGIEVHLAPRLSGELIHAIKPGDRVTVHGLRATGIAMMHAVSVMNDATRAVVSDIMLPGWPGPNHPWPNYACREPPPRYLEAKGRVKSLTHDGSGDVNGAMLDDGTVIRFAQGLTLQEPDCLVPGRNIAATGIGLAGALGKVLSSRSITLVPATADGRASVQARCVLESVHPHDAGGRKLPLINPPEAPASR
jgi:hypothetical protein